MGDFFREQIQNDKLLTLYDYWAGESANGRLMALCDIDPAKICKSLPNTVLLDVVANPRRFHCRFAGTAIDGKNGQFLTDTYIGDVETGGLGREAVAVMNGVVDERSPAHLNGEFMRPDDTIDRYERVALPLSSGGTTVDAILVGIAYAQVEFPELEDLDFACYG